MRGKYIIIFILIYIVFNIIDRKPNVIQINNFLDGKICDKIINIDKIYKPSGIIENGINVRNTNARTSSTTSFLRGENEYIDNISKRVCKMLNIHLEHLEPVQLSKYDNGQQYKYHHDYFKKIDNQRQYTVIIYLNSIPKHNGGSTDFYYGNNFQPKRGSLLYWSNLNSNGTVNYNTLHAGKPIKGDVKYILTLWSRVNKISI
jgi:prolyl 4-hydroxylase